MDITNHKLIELYVKGTLPPQTYRTLCKMGITTHQPIELLCKMDITTRKLIEFYVSEHRTIKGHGAYV